MELRGCYGIGQWVSTQRALKSKRELTLERVTLLKDIKFQWQLRRGRPSSKINAYKAVFRRGKDPGIRSRFLSCSASHLNKRTQMPQVAMIGAGKERHGEVETDALGTKMDTSNDMRASI